MRAHTPQGDPPGSARRSSAGNHFRSSSGGGSGVPTSSLPRPQTSLRESRIGIRTASYNPPDTSTPTMPPPRRRSGTAATGFSRESSKENMAPPDAQEYETQRRRIEELKAELGTLRYTIRDHEQEKEMARLERENELRDARRRADDDFSARQAAESAAARATRHAESLAADLDALRAEQADAKAALEKRARDAEDEARQLREQLEDIRVARDDAARRAEREASDLNAQLASLRRTTQELEHESQTRDGLLQTAREQLAQRDEAVAGLEAEVLRLKAQTGDAETVAVIRRELTDQVSHIRSLEAANRDQLAELRALRQTHRAVEVVEEEKMALRRRLNAAHSLEAELTEERLQRQRLEDERRAWAAYLGTETNDEFDSPEAVARALAEERLNSASLLEKLGETQPQIADRDNIIRALDREKTALQEQLAAKTVPSREDGTDKVRLRLERQRALAVKEAEYLRAQLQTFDAEDAAYRPEAVDQSKSDRIRELQGLVDQYREEVDKLHAELSEKQKETHSAGTKRPRPDDAENEQLGQLARKNRTLQDELSELHKAHTLLQQERAVADEQLAAAREQSRTRILALRANPTAEAEAVKTETLRALRRENEELLAQIEGRGDSLVPSSQLAAARRDVEAARAETASAHKSARRLKEVWGAKSAEFREAVFGTLGWSVAFMPNGKMRVESLYQPSRTDENENSIVFDGDKGTMKVGGGPRSPFAQRIGDNIRFWVRERGCVPCFLAALTLEFYDEHTRAAGGSRAE